MTAMPDKKPFVFTGWHMLAVMFAFFGTIISVNFLMAYYATSTWSGLVVQNTYVASQEFNGKAHAIKDMLATGITGKMTVADGEIRYTLTLAGKEPVDADHVTAHFKRPVGEHQDFTAVLIPAGNGNFVAKHDVLSGHWIVEVKAEKDGVLLIHEANRIAVKEDRK